MRYDVHGPFNALTIISLRCSNFPSAPWLLQGSEDKQEKGNGGEISQLPPSAFSSHDQPPPSQRVTPIKKASVVFLGNPDRPFSFRLLSKEREGFIFLRLWTHFHNQTSSVRPCLLLEFSPLVACVDCLLLDVVCQHALSLSLPLSPTLCLNLSSSSGYLEFVSNSYFFSFFLFFSVFSHWVSVCQGQICLK